MGNRISHAVALILAAVLTIGMVALIAGCANRSRVLYEDDVLTVTRQGLNTTIVTNDGGKGYHFTTKRIKRTTDAEEAIQRLFPAVLVDSVDLLVETVSGNLIVTEKATGRIIVVP